MKGSGWVLGLALAAATPADADVLLLDAIASAPPNTSDGLLRPRSGLSMSSVREKFGEPIRVRDPVGVPPITRWDYPAYTVYFEHRHVINVVVHRE